tara:strand:- start:68 stop:190 length:123 start_codon:yes stop_codon:yes gene_type:complete
LRNGLKKYHEAKFDRVAEFISFRAAVVAKDNDLLFRGIHM